MKTKSFAIVMMLIAGFLLVWQALPRAPIADEPGHRVAAIATVQTGDAAYYRINPPLPKDC